MNDAKLTWVQCCDLIIENRRSYEAHAEDRAADEAAKYARPRPTLNKEFYYQYAKPKDRKAMPRHRNHPGGF